MRYFIRYKDMKYGIKFVTYIDQGLKLLQIYTYITTYVKDLKYRYNKVKSPYASIVFFIF